MPQGSSRSPAPDAGSDHTRGHPRLIEIAASFEEVAAIVRERGLTVMSVVSAPPGFDGHWRVVGGGGHILYFSRKPGDAAIYLSEYYRNAWAEIAGRRL